MLFCNFYLVYWLVDFLFVQGLARKIFLSDYEKNLYLYVLVADSLATIVWYLMHVFYVLRIIMIILKT